MQAAIDVDALEERTDKLVREATCLTTKMNADDLLATDLAKEAGKASLNVLEMACGKKVGDPQTAVKLRGELEAEAKEARHICQMSAKKACEAWAHVLDLRRLTFTEMRLVEVEARLETLESTEMRLTEVKARLETLESLRSSSHPGGVTKKRKCA